MKILVTGGDGPLAAVVVPALRDRYELRVTGASPERPDVLGGVEYAPADLREPDPVAPLVQGVDAVLHLAPYSVATGRDPRTEKQVLDEASCGTYVLALAAVGAGVPRMVLASRLEVLSGYPQEFIVDSTWKPAPAANAAAMAPWLAELTLREVVRAESLLGICLRFGPLGDAPEGTTPADAIVALTRALEMDPEGRRHRWWLFHAGSTDRFPLRTAADAPLSFQRQEVPHAPRA